MGFNISHFERLDSTKHMLQWLYDKPYQQIFDEVERLLTEQVAGAKLQEFCVSSDPDWLTCTIKQNDNPNYVIVKNVGVAFEFELAVTYDGKTDKLFGVWTSVGYNLNTPSAQTQIWFDINGTLDEFGKEGALMQRMHSH